MRTFSAALLFSLALAPAAFAGDVQISLHDGRADVTAHNAALSQVLAEWARVGQVRIENGERVPGGPVTIELRDVPEAAALDTLLRAVAGFIAVPRSASTAGSSQFARILILPVSAAPAVVAATRPTATPAPPPFQTFPAATGPRPIPPGATPVLGADGRPIADDQDGAPVQNGQASMPPGFAQPAQVAPAQPAVATPSPVPAYNAPTPGAAVPGMITQQPGVVPQQPGAVPPQPGFLQVPGAALPGQPTTVPKRPQP